MTFHLNCAKENDEILHFHQNTRGKGFTCNQCYEIISCQDKIDYDNYDHEKLNKILSAILAREVEIEVYMQISNIFHHV